VYNVAKSALNGDHFKIN